MTFRNESCSGRTKNSARPCDPRHCSGLLQALRFAFGISLGAGWPTRTPAAAHACLARVARRLTREWVPLLSTTRSAGNGFAIRAAVARAHDTARACHLACAIGHNRRARHSDSGSCATSRSPAHQPVKVAFANEHVELELGAEFEFGASREVTSLLESLLGSPA